MASSDQIVYVTVFLSALAVAVELLRATRDYLTRAPPPAQRAFHDSLLESAKEEALASPDKSCVFATHYTPEYQETYQYRLFLGTVCCCFRRWFIETTYQNEQDRRVTVGRL